MRKVLLLVAVFAIFSIGTSAQDSITSESKQDQTGKSKKSENNILLTAKNYLTYLYNQDFEKLEKLMSNEMVFDDPTAIAFSGKAWKYEGKANILKFFKRSSQGTNSGFEIKEVFKTGEYVIFSLFYKGELDGSFFGIKDKKIILSAIPATTIIRVRNGLVIGHTDYVNYEELLKQVESQK